MSRNGFRNGIYKRTLYATKSGAELITKVDSLMETLWNNNYILRHTV